MPLISDMDALLEYTHFSGSPLAATRLPSRSGYHPPLSLFVVWPPWPVIAGHRRPRIFSAGVGPSHVVFSQPVSEVAP